MTTSPTFLAQIIGIVVMEPGLHPVSGPWTPEMLALARMEFTAAQNEMVRKRHAAVMRAVDVVVAMGGIGVGM